MAPKTVGEDSGSADGDGSGSGETSGSGDASASNDGASQSDGATSTSADDGASISESDSGGPWDDCAGKACGELCDICDPEDPNCALPGTDTVCLPSGVCDIPPEDGQPCPGVGVEPGFEQELTGKGGCADMTVYALNADDTLALHVVVDGLVAEAEQNGSAMHEYAADDSALTIELTYGSDLTVATCTDFARTRPTVLERWRPQPPESGDAGTVAITVQMVGDEPRASVTFTNVNFHRIGFDGIDPDIVVPSFEISDVLVGWLPG
jgi:hypothetical protein